LPSRRALIRGAAGSALLVGIGMRAIAHAQAGTILIGHLVPRTGPRGSLGDHAVMGVQLAAEEINAAGGCRIALVLADASDPHTVRAKAERLVRRDKVALLIGDAERAGLDTLPMPASFVATFARRYGKPPLTSAWIDYVALKIAALSLAGQSSRRQGSRV